MAATPESKVKQKVKDLLAEYAGIYYEMPVPSGYGKSGLDFWGIYYGKGFMIETKAEGQKPTKLQDICIRNATNAGGAVFVVTGGDPYSLEVVKRWLDIQKQWQGKC